MALKIDVHPEAKQEIVGSLRYYERTDPMLAEDLDARIDTAVDLIAAKPDTWSPYLHGTRRYLLDRFPYALIYRERAGVIQLVALVHHRRKPGYWSDRLSSD